MKLMTPKLKELQKKTVAVVGCGNLGTKNARLLSRWGVNLILIDFDRVSKPNLGTQEYCEKDVGKCKVNCLKRELKKINSKIKINSINKKLNEKNAFKLLEKADVVVDSTDNLETRLLINKVCKKLKIPWVYGSVEKNKGVVGVFNKKYGFDKLVSKKTKTNKVDNVGVTPEIAAIVTGIQVSKVVKLLTGKKLKKELIFIDLNSLEIEKIKNVYS